MYALIAEFDAQRAAIYRKAVEAHQIEAVLVRDGHSASEVLQARGAPILLIADLSLPRIDGLTLVAELRRIAPPDRTAILVHSPFTELRAAAWNLRGSLGILEVGEGNALVESVEQSVSKALASIRPESTRAQSARTDPEELFRKVIVRTQKTFRTPIVVLSVEVREGRRVVAHMDIHEVRSSPHLWSVIQQISHARQPLIVPDVAKQSLFGLSTDAPTARIRGFVSVPLLTSGQRLVGVLSLLDFKPLALTAAQIDLVLDAARKIADELERELESELAEAPVETIRANSRWAQLARLALTDRLTGLSNRHAGERALEREAARARRAGTPFSLALLDLDHFKQVNDRHGHAVGDEILRQVSQVLASTFRASDLAVRWGGDEFLILLPDVAAKGATIFAERARMHIETLTFPTGHITMSGGVVEIGKDESPREGLARADAQLYEAKRAGRNRVSGSA